MFIYFLFFLQSLMWQNYLKRLSFHFISSYYCRLFLLSIDNFGKFKLFLAIERGIQTFSKYCTLKNFFFLEIEKFKFMNWNKIYFWKFSFFPEKN